MVVEWHLRHTAVKHADVALVFQHVAERLVAWYATLPDKDGAGIVKTRMTIFLGKGKDSIALPVGLLGEGRAMEDVFDEESYRWSDTASPFDKGGGIYLAPLLVGGVAFRHMCFLGTVAIRHMASRMGAYEVVTCVDLNHGDILHDFDLLADILERYALEVPFRAYADMVSATEFHLLAHTEAVHAFGQRKHLRLLISLEDLTACAPLVRQRAVFLK